MMWERRSQSETEETVFRADIRKLFHCYMLQVVSHSLGVKLWPSSRLVTKLWR